MKPVWSSVGEGSVQSARMHRFVKVFVNQVCGKCHIFLKVCLEHRIFAYVSVNKLFTLCKHFGSRPYPTRSRTGSRSDLFETDIYVIRKINYETVKTFTITFSSMQHKRLRAPFYYTLLLIVFWTIQFRHPLGSPAVVMTPAL